MENIQGIYRDDSLFYILFPDMQLFNLLKD